MKILFSAILLLSISLASFGEVASNNPATPDSALENKQTLEGMKASSTSDALAGDFGMGVGIGINVLSDDHINNAIITNDRVNITDSESTRTQLWLEAHYLFGGKYTKWTCDSGCKIFNESTGESQEIPAGKSYYRNRRFYHGPFFAVQLSDSDSIFNGAALGYMISLKKTAAKGSQNDDRYFNIGLGVSTTKVQGLGAGLQDGSSFNTSEQLTYRNSSETGLLLLFSVNIF